MNSNSVKLLKVLFGVVYWNFALKYIAFLLSRVINLYCIHLGRQVGLS